MDQGKSLIVALSQDAALNRPVEAREHVRRMHELFFTLAPDKAAIESNINRAMYLADKSLYSYYRDWNEKGYYNRLISGISTRLSWWTACSVISITIRTGSPPLPGR